MKKSYIDCILLLFVLLWPVFANAQMTPEPGHIYKLVNRGNNRVLEIGGYNRYAPGHAANTWGYYGGANQQWSFETTSSGGQVAYKITNRNSRQFLGVANMYSLASQDFERPDAAQVWQILPRTVPGPFPGTTQGAIAFALPGTGFLLTANPYGNDEVYATSPFDFSAPAYVDYQIWDIIDVTANPSGTTLLGVYEVTNLISGKALTGNTDDNHVSQTTNHGLASQQWTFAPGTSPGQFFIVNRNNGKVLEIGGANTTPGSSTNIWDNYGHPWQQWAIYPGDDLYDQYPLTAINQASYYTPYKIKSIYAGKVLEIGGSANDITREDRPATLWYDFAAYSGNEKQRWFIRFASANRTAGPGGTTTSAATSATNVPKSAELPATSERVVSAGQKVLGLYPNPARNVLAITIPGAARPTSVTITDARGAAVQARYQENGQLDISYLAPGLYLVTVSDGHQVYRQKFVKN